jgi:hypothetical protein
LAAKKNAAEAKDFPCLLPQEVAFLVTDGFFMKNLFLHSLKAANIDADFVDDVVRNYMVNYINKHIEIPAQGLTQEQIRQRRAPFHLQRLTKEPRFKLVRCAVLHELETLKHLF